MTGRAALRASTISEVCGALALGDLGTAAGLLERRYPFVPPVEARRPVSRLDSMRVFLRDGFVDRYTGDRLVFPGALRVISEVLPEHFPFHPHGKMSVSHVAHWELSPSVDHVVPVARGGAHDMGNWVTTSMLRNQVKSHWTLEELGWELVPPGRLEDWDGCVSWFVDYAENHPHLLETKALVSWHRVARQAVGEVNEEPT